MMMSGRRDGIAIWSGVAVIEEIENTENETTRMEMTTTDLLDEPGLRDAIGVYHPVIAVLVAGDTMMMITAAVDEMTGEIESENENEVVVIETETGVANTVMMIDIARDIHLRILPDIEIERGIETGIGIVTGIHIGGDMIDR